MVTSKQNSSNEVIYHEKLMKKSFKSLGLTTDQSEVITQTKRSTRKADAGKSDALNQSKPWHLMVTIGRRWDFVFDFFSESSEIFPVFPPKAEMIVGLLLAFLLLVVIFHIFIYHQYNWPGYWKLINKIPGPSGIFYFGSTLRFYKLKNEELLYDIIEGFKTYGPTYRHWYSGVAVVFVSDLEDVQTVLSSRQNNCKGMLYRNILPWLGSGLLTSSGKKWQTMRKIITPTFHFSILHGYIDVFTKNAKVLLKVLEKEAAKDECDLTKFVTYCALDNVCETAMGTSINALSTGNDNKYVQAIFRMGQILVERMFNPLYFTNASFAFTSVGWEHNQILKILHGFTLNIIQERKKRKPLQNKIPETIEKEADSYSIYKKKCSFLDMLLESQEAFSLSSKDIREEVDTFMFEGHDTTSAAINWVLFELGHHPLIQEQCYEELNKIFEGADRSPTYQDLMEMTFLKRVIQESLRLYPSVPVISRKFDVDLQLKEYLVPAHTEIVLMLYGIHRNPKVFEDPDKFDPDRFLPEAVEARHPFAYIPFSAGQRNCVGQKFALLEELVILSTIIRHFKVQSLDDRDSVKVVPEMILRPHVRLRFKITKRN